MSIIDFVATIYLGDRAIKKIIVDTWGREISIEIDLISRIRSDDGNWNFYSDEDIENGLLVFQKVKKFVVDKDGALPNDYINSLEVERLNNEEYCFSIKADSVDDDGLRVETNLQIFAQKLGIRSPENPKELILE